MWPNRTHRPTSCTTRVPPHKTAATRRAADSHSGPKWKICLPPQQWRTGCKSSNKIGKSVSCRVTWASCERLSLYNRQTGIIRRAGQRTQKWDHQVVSVVAARGTATHWDTLTAVCRVLLPSCIQLWISEGCRLLPTRNSIDQLFNWTRLPAVSRAGAPAEVNLQTAVTTKQSSWELRSYGPLRSE